MTEPHVYIVLVNWNGAADTLECLESALRLDYPSFEIIVCDNASSDGSVEAIQAWACGSAPAVVAANPRLAHLVEPNVPKPLSIQVLTREQAEAAPAQQAPAKRRITVIRTGANLGFAGGNNVGIRYAQACGHLGYVWLLNNDTVVERGALSYLHARADASRRTAIVGSTLVFYGNESVLQAAGGASYSPVKALATPLMVGQPRTMLDSITVAELEARAAYVVGASMLVPSEFLETVGLMAEDYFLYFEELDWAERGRRCGFGLAYARESVVFHKVGASTGASISTRLNLAGRLSYFNRLLVTRRFFAHRLWIVRVRIALEALRALLVGRKDEASYAWLVARGHAGNPVDHRQ